MKPSSCATCRFCVFDDDVFQGYVVDVCDNPKSERHTHLLNNIEESGCDEWAPELDDSEAEDSDAK